MEDNQHDDPPVSENYCEAREGDLTFVLFAKDETETWIMGEVVSVTKAHARVKTMLDRAGTMIKVGPRDKMRIASMSKLNKQRALKLLRDSPEGGFSLWEAAREYIQPAKLREGEDTGDIEEKKSG